MLHDELFRNNEEDEGHDLDEQGNVLNLVAQINKLDN